jgi:hypothetical protein
MSLCLRLTHEHRTVMPKYVIEREIPVGKYNH